MTGLNPAANPGRHAHAVRGLDLYETPAVAVEALLRVEKLDHWQWEPAAGCGAIATVLRDHVCGHRVRPDPVRRFPPALHWRFFRREEGSCPLQFHRHQSPVSARRSLRPPCARSGAERLFVAAPGISGIGTLL
jgi:hypothetical protein